MIAPLPIASLFNDPMTQTSNDSMTRKDYRLAPKELTIVRLPIDPLFNET